MESLRAAFQNNEDYKPYISSIVFPSFKNISPGEELTFEFPLTLLIGKNGTNKSSVLHALYGCPHGKNVGEYWFSTHTDYIAGVDGNRPAYFYRYTISDSVIVAEVINTRIKDDIDSDLWETSRPVKEYNMNSMPILREGESIPKERSKTRWNPIQKGVLYLDFRAEISAFDKAFYKDVKGPRAEYRNILRARSRPLKEVIERELPSKIYHRKERITVNYTFSEEQTNVANSILDADYIKIVYIEHDFFLNESFSVYLRKGNLQNYSEAFAGSGETSVIRLLYALENAPPKSLILLDEPETSLHIEAQYRLRDYILRKIQEKKLQVVVSTHSPFFTRDLPECAIKILYIDETSKRVRIINSAPADESSFYLGYRRNAGNKANVWVEDALAYAIAFHVYNTKLTASQKDKLNIIPHSGGSTALINRAASEMLDKNSNACFLFDGDQKPVNGIPDPATIPEADNDKLPQLLTGIFGFVPKFPLDSNNAEQKIKYMRQYLAFARERFKYFEFKTPEEFIVSSHKEFAVQDRSVTAKERLDKYATDKLGSSGDVRAPEILTIQRQLIPDIPEGDPTISDTASKLKEFLAFAP